MRNNSHGLVKNFTYTILSNLFSMCISILVTFVVPKLIGVEDYGFWQLYLFYSLYVGIMHFGWNDGIYLRYGGKDYNELDKKVFNSQFYMMLVFQLIIAAIIVVLSCAFVENKDKLLIFNLLAACLIIVNLRGMLLLILQSTNRIKDYARITIMDRGIYGIMISILLIGGVREYKLMIIADLIGKFASFLYAAYCCKDIVFQNFSKVQVKYKEMIRNINVGIKLTFANIASMLIIGVVRFGIEHSWGVSTFGKVSLTFNISNFVMIFINAIGIVLFPFLRRRSKDERTGFYILMRDTLMILLFGMLVIYYPFKEIISRWLPSYKESLRFMAILFPMCVYEGKMSLLINTYLKTLRKEKLLLQVNLITLLISVASTLIFAYGFKSLNLTVLSIVILLAFRCIYAELKLSKLLGVSVIKDVIIELMVSCVFISISWFIDTWIIMVIYIFVYMIYLTIKKEDIKEVYYFFKNRNKTEKS